MPSHLAQRELQAFSPGVAALIVGFLRSRQLSCENKEAQAHRLNTDIQVSNALWHLRPLRELPLLPEVKEVWGIETQRGGMR